MEGELAVSQIVSQVEENGGEFSDEQNDDSYQNTKDIISQVNAHADISQVNAHADISQVNAHADISQVNAHADGDEFELSSLIESTPKPNNAKKKRKKEVKTNPEK